MAAIEAHRKYYKQFVDELREDRKERIRVKEHREFNNERNIGMKVLGCPIHFFLFYIMRVCAYFVFALSKLICSLGCLKFSLHIEAPL